MYLLIKNNNNNKTKQEKIKLSFILISFYFCKLAWYVYTSIKVVARKATANRNLLNKD